MLSSTRVDSPASRWAWLFPLALGGVGLLGWACQEPTNGNSRGGQDTDGSDEITRRDVLRSIAAQVIVPGTAEFASRATALSTAVDALAAARSSGADVEAARQAARDSWHEAMSQWQELELMQVGPAASSLAAIGGEDLRDEIYSWPTADTCAVDRAIVDEDYGGDGFVENSLVWVYGLDALEYLLFTNTDEHTCPSQVQLDGPWMALSGDELDTRRAAYASVLAAHIAEQANALATRWDPSGGNFAGALGNPGEGDSPYANDLEALDQVFHAMFYIDKQTKDAKLGLPLGLVEGCDAVPCVSLLENPWSDDAGPSLVANLRMLQALVQGGPDPETAAGFDDLLEQMGEGAIALTLLRDIDTAIATIEAIEAPMSEAIATDVAQVEAAYGAVKKVSDTLKGPFVTALMLTIPAEGAGDAD